MSADLIVYAIVAAGLIFWLRSILGTRHGEEHERPNPYLAPEPGMEADQGARPAQENEPKSQEDQIRDLAETSKNQFSIDSKTAEQGLIDIAAQDKSFDIKTFLSAAEDVFVFVVEGFADGDKETLKDLLAEPVYKVFEEAIDARERRHEILETEIHAIRKVDVVSATLEKDNMAYISLLFTADETNVTRDKGGDVIDGDPDRVNEMHDLWTFGRNLKGKDPRWLVYETRSDFDLDNDIVPNSDKK